MTFYFTFIFLPGWDFDIIIPLCNLIAVVKIWVIENSFFFFLQKESFLQVIQCIIYNSLDNNT